MDKAERFISDFNNAKDERKPVEEYWRGAYRVTAPERGVSLGLTWQDTAKITDNTAQQGIRLFSASLLSSITPSGNQWATAQARQGVKVSKPTELWLKEVSDIATSELLRSNFYAVALEFYKEQSTVGMCGLFAEFNDDSLRFEVWRPENIYVAASTGRGIDTIYRVTPLTISQAQERFGKLPTSLADLVSDNENYDRSEKYDFLHIIHPNTGKIGVLSKDLPVLSTYVYLEDKEVVQESGFDEMPTVVPRWSTLPNSVYSVGILHEAITAAMDLNVIKNVMRENAETAVEPPYVLADDGVLNVDNITIGKSTVIMAKDTQNIKRLSNESDLPYALNYIAELKSSIRDVMMVDELLPSNRPNATATEIRTRTTTLRAILGGSFLQLETEFLPGITDRFFGLLFRAGKFPEPSEEVVNDLADEEGSIFINVVYNNAATRANQLSLLEQVDIMEATIMNQAQIIPGALDVYDFDKANRERADKLGISPVLIKSEDQVDEQRAAQQEAAAEQQQQPQGAPPVQ